METRVKILLIATLISTSTVFVIMAIWLGLTIHRVGWRGLSFDSLTQMQDTQAMRWLKIVIIIVMFSTALIHIILRR
jgi:hypothetical protein